MTDRQADRQTALMLGLVTALQASKSTGNDFCWEFSNIQGNRFRSSYFAEKFKTDRTDRIASAAPRPLLSFRCNLCVREAVAVVQRQ